MSAEADCELWEFLDDSGVVGGQDHIFRYEV